MAHIVAIQERTDNVDTGDICEPSDDLEGGDSFLFNLLLHLSRRVGSITTEGSCLLPCSAHSAITNDSRRMQGYTSRQISNPARRVCRTGHQHCCLTISVTKLDQHFDHATAGEQTYLARTFAAIPPEGRQYHEVSTSLPAHGIDGVSLRDTRSWGMSNRHEPHIKST